mmetsp:Transcript_3293/g.7382  ORF Transcript_3293/g.7382 Transcript_3293/m.7382 type:complete len:487 (-) Transcript_3293:805-2265(-)
MMVDTMMVDDHKQGLEARASHDSLGADWSRESEQAPEEVCRLTQAELYERLEIMMDTEDSCRPRHDYIEQVQKDGMRVVWRSKVASWLLEFEEEYGISQETIAVAVNYMDRYLSQISTKKSILQLLAMGSIFVAAKLHETFPIGMHELRDLADGTYLESDIKLMELELLRVIQWKLTPVTPQSFMTHLVQFIPCTDARRLVQEDAVTFLDVVIPEYEFLKYSPSIIGTSAVLCALKTVRVDGELSQAWAASVARLGLLGSQEVKACSERMLEIFESMMSASAASAGPSLAPVATESAALTSATSTCAGRSEQVVSPVGVDELSYSESSFSYYYDDDVTQDMYSYPNNSDEDEDLEQHQENRTLYSKRYKGEGGKPFFHDTSRDLEAMEADEMPPSMGAPAGAMVFMDQDEDEHSSSLLQNGAIHSTYVSYDGLSLQHSNNPVPLSGAAGAPVLSRSCSVKSHAQAVTLGLEPPARLCLHRSRSATR